MGLKKLHTEEELLVYDKHQFYRLARLAKEDRQLFDTVCSHMPFYTTLNRRDNLCTTYVSNVLEGLMDLSGHDIIRLGFSKILEISDREVLKRALEIIDQYESYGDQEQLCCYLQRIKFHGKHRWINTIKTIFDEEQYFNVGYPLEIIGKPGMKLRDLLDEVLVDKNGWKKFETLSIREREILQKVAAGYSSREISDQLFISEHTVKTHRKNLATKLDAKSNADLVKFAKAFEMI